MKIEIELDEKQINFLKQYAEVYKSERDKDCTADPIVTVQVLEKDVTQEGYQDSILYVDRENEYAEFESLEEVIEYLIEDHDFCEEAANDAASNLDEDNEFVGDGIHIVMMPVKHNYKNVAYFLTRKEAEKYVSYQRHNLNAPRVYTEYMGYSNYGDLQCLAKLLLGIGKQLNEQDNEETNKED